MNKENNLFFRLANETPLVVEAAYKRWRVALENDSIPQEIDRIVKEVSDAFEKVQHKHKAISPNSKQTFKRSEQSIETDEITCPVCSENMAASKICPHCKEGQSGLSYKYQCSCGVSLYSKEKI